jgi:hypothetical protein
MALSDSEIGTNFADLVGYIMVGLAVCTFFGTVGMIWVNADWAAATEKGKRAEVGFVEVSWELVGGKNVPNVTVIGKEYTAQDVADLLRASSKSHPSSD